MDSWTYCAYAPPCLTESGNRGLAVSWTLYGYDRVHTNVGVQFGMKFCSVNRERPSPQQYYFKEDHKAPESIHYCLVCLRRTNSSNNPEFIHARAAQLAARRERSNHVFCTQDNKQPIYPRSTNNTTLYTTTTTTWCSVVLTTQFSGP